MLLSSFLLACLRATPPGAQSCSDCHSSSEGPFVAPGGVTDPTARTVGAHGAHLWEPRWSRPAECTDCHPAVGAVDAEGHLDEDGPALPADVSWGASDVASGEPYDASGLTCTVSCHGLGLDGGGTDTTPVWTDPATTVCGSCHGTPPPAPHPQNEGCPICHTPATPEWEKGDPALHVDGTLQEHAPISEGCDDCHGIPGSPAPPPDLSGSSDTTRPSVGAHATHVGGTATSAAVACGDCHPVPDDIALSPHDDGATDVVFSGVALSPAHAPSYTPSTCADTYCHVQRGGADDTPDWTDVAGALPCGSCHAMPPPSPHPGSASCENCHPPAGPGQTIVSPADHVNGTVDL